MPNTVHLAGATSKIVTFRIFDATSGLPDTTIAWNTATLSATYTRDNSTAVAITLSAGVAGTWSSGGFIHAGKGEYELGAPNAALVAGADGVRFKLDGVANKIVELVRVELVGVDPRSAALPAVNATQFGGQVVTAAAGVTVPSSIAPAATDTPGTTTLLSRITGALPLATDYTSARATKLDNLDAAISSRSTYAGTDTAGTTTLLSRVTATVPTAAQISTQVQADAVTTPLKTDVKKLNGTTLNGNGSSTPWGP